MLRNTYYLGALGGRQCSYSLICSTSLICNLNNLTILVGNLLVQFTTIFLNKKSHQFNNTIFVLRLQRR